MTKVERRHVGDAEPLGEGNEAGIDTAKPEVSVGVDQFGDALPVGRGECLDGQVAVNDRAVEAGLGRRSELSIDQPAGFRHHQRRRDERSGVTLQQRLTPNVVRIGVISGGENDVGVDQQCQRPNPSASISSSSLARRPVVEEPRLTNPSLRRGGKRSARTSAANASGATPRSAAAAATRVARSSSISTVSFVVIRLQSRK
jgi:hypothetical protein